MYIQTRKCTDMFTPCIYIPDNNVYTQYIHGIYMFQQTYTYSEISVHVHILYDMFILFFLISMHVHLCLFRGHT